MKWASVIVLASTAALAGCGASEKDKFVKEFKPANDRLIDIGRALQPAIEDDGTAPATFERIAKRIDRITAELRSLDPPEELADDATKLERALTRVERDLEDLADARRAQDPDAVTRVSLTLLDDSDTVGAAQDSLAAATDADKGED